MLHVGPERALGPVRECRCCSKTLERSGSAVELDLAAQHSVHKGHSLLAQPCAADPVRARIHYSWLHHEQSRETLREQPGGEEKVGGSGAVSDAKDAGQIERFHHRANVLSEVQEVVAIARGFVAGAARRGGGGRT